MLQRTASAAGAPAPAGRKPRRSGGFTWEPPARRAQADLASGPSSGHRHVWRKPRRRVALFRAGRPPARGLGCGSPVASSTWSVSPKPGTTAAPSAVVAVRAPWSALDGDRGDGRSAGRGLAVIAWLATHLQRNSSRPALVGSGTDAPPWCIQFSTACALRPPPGPLNFFVSNNPLYYWTLIDDVGDAAVPFPSLLAPKPGGARNRHGKVPAHVAARPLSERSSSVLSATHD